MGGIRKKKTKRGVEHHKQSLEQTLEAPETYGVRVRPLRILAQPESVNKQQVLNNPLNIYRRNPDLQKGGKRLQPTKKLKMRSGLLEHDRLIKLARQHSSPQTYPWVKSMSCNSTFTPPPDAGGVRESQPQGYARGTRPTGRNG